MKRIDFLVFAVLIACISFPSTAQIISVNPDTLTQGEDLDIVVTAENIDFTQGSNIVNFIQGGTKITISKTNATNSSTLILPKAFNANTPFGSYDLSIDNTYSNKKFMKYKAVYVKQNTNMPRLDSISIKNASQDENIQLIVYGTDTRLIQTNSTSQVYLWTNGTNERIYPKEVNALSDTSLVLTFKFNYVQRIGIYSLHVKNDLDGDMSLSDAFELTEGLTPPKLTSISPDTLYQGEPLEVEVTGENIDFTQGSNVILLQQGTNYLRFDIPTLKGSNALLFTPIFNSDHLSGYYKISISNLFTGITLTKEDAIFVEPDLTLASIKSIRPLEGKRGEILSVTIKGLNTSFDHPKENKLIYLYNSTKSIYHKSINIIDSVTLEVQFDITYAYLVGEYLLKMISEIDGTIKAEEAFVLQRGENEPLVTDVTPDTMIVGHTLDIEITAENIDFTQGSNIVSLENGNTKIQMNSSLAKDKRLLNANFSIDKKTPAGNYTLSIYNSSFDLTLLANQTLIKEHAFYLKSANTGVAIEKTKIKTPLIFPNPTSDFLNFDKAYDIIELIDLKGIVLLSERDKDQIDISFIVPGNYIVRLTHNNSEFIKKLIIK